jgi:hypothetical protein
MGQSSLTETALSGRLSNKKYTVRYRVIKAQNVANEFLWGYFQSLCPYLVAVGWNAASTRLKLRDERVIFCAHELCELSLRKAGGLPALSQPSTPLSAELLHAGSRTPLWISVHGMFRCDMPKDTPSRNLRPTNIAADWRDCKITVREIYCTCKN